ncbi:9708_t:CDS:2, partial [Gigaspora margarita]
MSSKKPKETKTTLTNEQRKDIIKYKKKNSQISQADLVSWVKQTMVQDNDEEPTTNNDDDIIEELYRNIELLNFQNIMDLEEYIDYSEKKIVESDEEDDSVKMPQITHKEALDAVYQIELYLMQQDFNYVVQTEHDVVLSKLYELVRKLQNASFKQLSIETFFEL